MKRIIILIAVVITFDKISFSANLDSGLAAYYPFNGNPIDESGNGNHGTNFGATLTTDRFGRSNKAYAFNQTYIEIPNSSSLQSPTNSLTLAFWTNISQWDLNTAAFMAKSNSGSTGQYGSSASSSPNIQFDLGGQSVSFARSLSRNTWHFICFNWDGQKLKLFLNGSLMDSIFYSGPIAPDNFPLILGKRTPSAIRYLRGKLDDIRIYNRALLKTEIQQLYNESILNLNIIPQGLYNSSSAKLRIRDTVSVYLSESFSPYMIIDSSKSVIDSISFMGNFKIFVPHGSYYIVVKHRNSIETWSRSPVDIDEGVTSYDFTTSASQAYGNNMVLNGSKYCIFSGDVNKDGIIDATDVSLIDNDAYNFVTGYTQTDLTGDSFTDGSDYIIADNNAFNFINAISPNTFQPPCNLTCNRMFSWSGFTWCVISSNETKCSPGPNYFSSSFDNVRVDSAGDLRLRITKRNGMYYCAELFTIQRVGYGLYTFYLSSRVDNLDKNAVLGLFTWNDKNCVTNANSELDIEFTRWGDAGNPDILEYSIQPTNGGQETDRFTTWPMQLNNNYSIHFFNWTPSLVSFSSYQGHTIPPPVPNLISSWSFDTNNIPKSKEECSSNPIIIPAPETNTTLNLNLWLDRGNYPSNDQEVEVIIHRIDFSPQLFIMNND